MGFVEFRDKLANHFYRMTQDVDHLFQVDLDKDELWNTYLDSFPPGTNDIYRERREHDCSCCCHFIKTIGNVVVLREGKVTTLWDLHLRDTTYQVVTNALDTFVKTKAIKNVYLAPYANVGTSFNLEMLEDGTIKQWDHFYLDIPNKFTNRTVDTIDTVLSNYKSCHDVFLRSLKEITKESIDTVLELIGQNSLYKGGEWKSILQKFLELKKEFMKLSSEKDQDLYAWEKSVSESAAVTKIRNHSMGTLLVNISEGMGLDAAVTQYEKITAPENYKRPKAIYTKKMLEEAKNLLTELGYMDSLTRRFATLDDITVNNILFSNKDSAKRITGAMDLFDEMEKEVAIDPKRFSRVEEVGIEDFIKNILPTAKEIELLLENKHVANMVSLVAPVDKEAKTMFKWDNGFSWAYTGNMTDSSMKERVKAAGGKVDGDLRFSIQWNDEPDIYDKNDLDAHCIEPSGEEIYFPHNRSRRTGGELDVDITTPLLNVPAVENITWADRRSLVPGVYKFFVHQFRNRGGRGGFRAEIEFGGQIYSYNYNKELRQNEQVLVAEVTVHEDKSFSISEKLPSAVSSRKVWGLNTNQFIPVSVISYSPNYWDEQKGIGHKHYFFMLKDCINPESPNGMFNEYLKEDLMKYKRVFEALGSKMAVPDCREQLSGVGFSSTKRSEVMLKVKGITERIIKVKF